MEKIQIREGWKDKEHCDLIVQAAQSLYEYGILEKSTLEEVLDAVSNVKKTLKPLTLCKDG